MNRRERREKRRQRKRKLVARGVAVFCALALIAASAYFIYRYKEDRKYLMYPLKYKELITQYAREYELDPALVAALIRTESSFNPGAVSPVGALGLMQIMPDTGDWIAMRLGEAFDAENLKDAERNIRYGCWYLMYLCRRYGGDVKCAAAAYHGGFGAVDKWLEDPQYSSDGKTLDAIPYAQTAIYADTILERYEIYKTLYTFDD